MAAPTPAVAALVRAGVAHTLHTYVHDPGVASYGEEAAAVLGAEAARVFKTLVCSVGDALAVAVVPVPRQLDLKALAGALGVKRAELAEPAAAKRVTGYVVGAISPLGQKRALPTVIDESASAWESIYCSGGRRGLEIEVDPADLVRLTGGQLARIATTLLPA